MLLNPSWQLNHKQPIDHSPLMGWGRESEGWKWENRWVEIKQFNRECKSCGCKQSKRRNYFTTSHGQAGAQPGKQGPITIKSDLGWQTPSLRMSSHFFSFPQLCALNMTPYSVGFSLGRLGSSVPAVPPLNSLCTPAPSVVGGVRNRKALGSV